MAVDRPFTSSTSSTPSSSSSSIPLGGRDLGSSGMSDLSDMSSDLSSGSRLSDTSTARPEEAVNRAAETAHRTVDRIAEATGPRLQRLQQGLKARSERMRETGDQWTGQLRDTVREKPIAAVATAVAIGALIARLTR